MKHHMSFTPVGVRNLNATLEKIFRSSLRWLKISNMFVGATIGRPRAFTERPYGGKQAISVSQTARVIPLRGGAEHYDIRITERRWRNEQFITT